MATAGHSSPILGNFEPSLTRSGLGLS